MVQIFGCLFKPVVKNLGRVHFRCHFLDTLRLTVHGGHGGNGIPKYGGIGGQGGCVYFLAKDGLTLRNVSQKLRDSKVAASSGEDSSKLRILGLRGADRCIEVPVGVQVLDDDGKLLADLNEENAKFIVAGGGMGGCTGTYFLGKPGEHRTINLNLKLIADVGLVGFPNAGKSTFLKGISNANPKIASYPFTTIRPQIGTVEYPDLRSITIADLPGLIEGAHANFGMGHKFLKHIERTRLILMVVDINGFQLSAKHNYRNCLENIYALNKELELYDSTLLEKPCVLLLNKMDTKNAKQKLKEYMPFIENLETGLEKCPTVLRPNKTLKFEQIIPISAINETRVLFVKQQLRQILADLAARQLLRSEEEIRNMLHAKIGESRPKIT